MKSIKILQIIDWYSIISEKYKKYDAIFISLCKYITLLACKCKFCANGMVEEKNKILHTWKWK